jgi:hypothetical protein
MPGRERNLCLFGGGQVTSEMDLQPGEADGKLFACRGKNQEVFEPQRRAELSLDGGVLKGAGD